MFSQLEILSSQLTVTDVPEKLTHVTFPPERIAEKINALKASSASGPDKIGSRVLKETSDILCGPLSIVFMRSLEEGVVPED